MRRSILISFCLLPVMLMAISCGSEKPVRDQAMAGDTTSAVPFTADSLLPESTSTTKRIGEPKTFLKVQAYEFLESSTSLYRDYQLVGQTSARYEVNGVTVFTDIAQCATEIDAYGLYASIRPDGIDTYLLGTEGYLAGNSLYFTQGIYVITLSTLDDTEKGPDAMRLLAVTISARIGTAGALPDQFALFPEYGQILPSTRYYPYVFLDIPGLREVYTASYLFGRDTMVLFLTEDKSGAKFVDVMTYAGDSTRLFSHSSGIAFDKDYVVTFLHPGHGMVLAGLKNLKLIGAVKYDDPDAETLVARWIDGLP